MEEEKGELPPIARPKVEKQGSARGQPGLSADGSLRAPGDGENGSGKDNEGILPSINRPGSGRSLGGGLSARDVMREGVDPVAMLSGGEGGVGGTSRSRKGSRKNSARGNASGEIASPGGDTTDALEDGDDDDGGGGGTGSPNGFGSGGGGDFEEGAGAEDPERDYWQAHKTAPKNSKNVLKELQKRVASAQATKKLDAGEMDLMSIPEKVFEMQDLRIVFLQGNKLEVLPPSVGKLRMLTQLRLFGNKLRWLPKEIGDCVALQILWVQDNLLISLPASIGNLLQLKILTVARNPLRSLPVDLTKCVNLKELDIDGLDDTLSIPPVDVVKAGLPAAFVYLKEFQRRLSWVEETATLDLSSMGLRASTLPLEVTNMTNITALNLAKNQMPAVSPSLCFMASLTDLDVSECAYMRELSPEMGVMKQLQRIGTFGTDLTSPPPEVVGHSAEAIVEYLATLYDARSTLSLHLNNIDIQHVDDAIASIRGLVHLSLASNRLVDVSPELSRLVDMHTLELQSNNLKTLPRELERCTALTHVNLSDNRLEGPLFAEPWVGAWTKMKYLNVLQNDKVSMLPMSIANWTSLEKLDLDESKFTQPPIEVLRKGGRSAVQYCQKFADTEGTVTKIELSGFRFHNYPVEINNLKGLKSLVLQYNDIKLLPDSMTILNDLREIHLSHNPLMVVPPVIAYFTQLRALRLDNTLLEELPSFLGKLVKLKGFSAVQNRFVSLPPEFGSMVSLTRINLDSNGLRSLPDTLGKLTALKDISLTRNKIGWIPASFGSLICVEELRVGFNRLHALPKEIGFMTSLVRLRCGNNLIDELPLEIEQLTNLEDLSVNNNQISLLPIVLGNLTRMRNINYDNNPITVPREDVLAQGSEGVIAFMTKMYRSALTHGLDMKHQSLQFFPAETLTVPALHSLVLDDNNLEELPKELMVLTSLTILSVQRNKLKRVATECGMMTSLTRLLLNDNKLFEIPLSFGRAKNLSEVDIQHNAQWQTPPPEVVKQGSGVIVNYLKKFGEAFDTKRLRLEGLKLEQFPRDVYKFTSAFQPLNGGSLTALSVSHNKIAEIPGDIDKHLGPLMELDLDENELEALPDQIGNLTNLVRLSFNRNYFMTFPACCCSCIKLQSLQFAGNPVIRIDPCVGYLTLLSDLLVDTERLEEPPMELVVQGCHAVVSYLGQVQAAISTLRLHLPNFKLVTFPPELTATKHHPVTVAPRLLEVSMPDNRLEAIPTSMSSLTSMTRLDLSNNRITKISVVLGTWLQLQSLDLSGNMLTELPGTIGNLKLLTVMRLSHNRLTVLPPFMAKLVNLRELYVQNNELDALFEGMHECVKLVTVSFSDNKLPSLPYELARLQHLQNIVLDNNPLHSPPPEIRGKGSPAVIDYLRRFDEAGETRALDLDGLGLKVFPLEIVAMSSLKVLSIRDNEIEVIPPVIGRMIGLEKLNLDRNRLIQLPVELGGVVALSELTLEGNDLRTPPSEIIEQGTSAISEYLKRMMHARKTQSLDLGALELRRTPVEVAFMTGLTSLSLVNNHLHKIFVGIGQLTLLTSLLLDYNELQTLPRTVCNLTNLTTLSLAHNKIKHIADWLHSLLPLRSLNIADNLLQELPMSLLRLTNLTHLNVEMNNFKDPPREIVVAGQEKLFKYMGKVKESLETNYLDFSNLGLYHLPLLHCDRTNLTRLNLDRNHLEQLPPEISKLVKLESISVRDNRLTRLPLSMGGLSRLKGFDTSGNDMTTPPPEVCELGAQQIVNFLYNVDHAAETKEMILQHMNLSSVPTIVTEQTGVTRLDLSHNKIVEVPVALLHLTTLTDICLDNNLIESIPDEIFKLRDLQIMSISNNRLVTIPPTFGDLARLRTLKLESNQIKELPPELGIAVSLSDCRVRDNPLRIPPPEVVKKGTRHFLDYLRRVIDLQRNNVCDLSEMGIVEPELPQYILRQAFVSTLLMNGNNLEDLDVSVTKLRELKVANFDGNKFKRVPEAVFLLHTLENLIVSNNELLEFGTAVSNLKNLKTLDLQGNLKLEFLPTSLGTMTNLEVLKLARCPLRSPPSEVVDSGCAAVVDYLGRIHKAETTKELFIEGFELHSMHQDKFDVHIMSLSDLKTLSLSQNRLSEVDPKIGAQLSNLTELYLRTNFLRDLPTGVAQLTLLTVLHLDQNELIEIAPWIGQLTCLVDLSISQNQLQYVTEAVGDLSRLRKLNLMSNKLMSIPPELCRLENMVSLNIDNNPLRSPPREVYTKGFGLVMDYLKRFYTSISTQYLHLSSLGLEIFPVEAQLYTSLTRIDLGDNNISELPRSIGNHPSLSDLAVAHNQLTRVHPNIEQLFALTRLQLPFNKLSTLPHSMSNLRNLALLNLVQNEFETLEVHLCTITTLTDLRVSHNKIHTVHQEVGLLKHLTRGDFDGNKLVTMPEGIGGCTALTHLNVAGNVLEALPEGMKHHTLLTCLDVTGNNLRMLPTGIGMCKNLDDFEYEDNPFDAIPPEILKQGSKLLIDYLSRFCIAGPPPGYEHIVGAFDGKTRSLNLDNLQLEHVPPYVYGLGYIEELSCKRNAIVDLPSEISLLRNLKKLRLESNLLRSLPLELCLCPLDELDLLFNNWEEPPAEVRDKGCKVILKYLQAQYISLKVGILDIRECYLEKLPPEIERIAGPQMHTIDMSDNTVEQLPNLRLLSYTREFKIGNNKLSNLPDSIRLLTALTSLHVPGNLLAQLPITFVHLTALLTLNLDANRFTAVPTVVCRLSALTQLSMSNNRIAVLDGEIGQLQQLREVRLATNGMHTVCDEICDATELRLVDLSNNNLEILPGGGCQPGHWERLSNLEALDVRGNLISTLPTGLGMIYETLTGLEYDDYELSQLPPEVLEEGTQGLLLYLRLCHETLDSKCLDLTDRSLQSVPSHIGGMLHLEEIRLSHNLFTELPEWIGNLKALRVLRLDNTGIRSLPLGLCDCAMLQLLDLDGLFLLSPPKQILAKGVPIIKEWLHRLRDAQGGRRLDLSSLGLEDWPVELSQNAQEGQYVNLRRLNLLDNILTELPVEICNLSTLDELCAGYNRMAEVHPKIGALTGLTRLILPFNQLTSLPDTVSLLELLSVVNMDNNRLKSIPECLYGLTGLEDLRLNQNEIEYIHADVARLINLRDLQMSYNSLTAVPRHIGYNTALTQLKFSYNQLSSIPGEVGLLTNLSDLQLTHNLLETLPPELGAVLPPEGSLTSLGLASNYFKAPLSQIILRGPAATLRYLREQI